MKIHHDSATTTGQDHILRGGISQDYCATGIREDGAAAYAVVSDGCSSGGHTDIGARLTCLTAARYIQQRGKTAFDPHVLEQHLFHTLKAQASFLNLSDVDMLATCVAAQLAEGEVHTVVQGDGIVAFRYKDGGLKLVRYEWSENAPLYPIYGEAEVQQLIAFSGAKLSVTTVSPTGEETGEEVDLLAQVHKSRMVEPAANLSAVALFSDGVLQLKDSNGSALDWKDVVRRLLDFKSYGGAFTKRKLHNAFLPAMAKEGRKPYDDLSYAVIHLEEEPNGGQ